MLNEYVFNYIEKDRDKTGDKKVPAIIIYNGHKTHLSYILFAKCAEKNISVVINLLHSTHLVQTLDQGNLGMMKNDYPSVIDWSDIYDLLHDLVLNGQKEKNMVKYGIVYNMCIYRVQSISSHHLALLLVLVQLL